MGGNESPGALAGATGDAGGNALALHLAPFAALDPAALAALGLVAARLWGAGH